MLYLVDIYQGLINVKYISVRIIYLVEIHYSPQGDKLKFSS